MKIKKFEKGTIYRTQRFELTAETKIVKIKYGL